MAKIKTKTQKSFDFEQGIIDSFLSTRTIPTQQECKTISEQCRHFNSIHQDAITAGTTYGIDADGDEYTEIVGDYYRVTIVDILSGLLHEYEQLHAYEDGGYDDILIDLHLLLKKVEVE